MQKIISFLLKTDQLTFSSFGSSMEPVLCGNDALRLKKISFGRIKPNDIIAIRQNKKLISHRVIYKTDKYLVTKGDNNSVSDGKIYPQQIIGKIYQVKRNGQVFNPENLYLLQSTLYFQEIVKIKTAFDKNKIDHVFLKGLPLHLYYEKTHPRRIYLDCDVLIDKNNLPAAEKILLKNGYKKVNAALSKTHMQFRKKEAENIYVKVINNFPVVFDLHLEAVFMMTQLGSLNSLYPQSLIDQLTADLLKTKRLVKINNEFFCLLSTNYLLLYLALHIFHHNFRGAFRYDFLDKIVRFSASHSARIHPGGVNWADITIKTNDFKLNNFVYPVFVLLKKYYQTPIPPSFFKSIKPTNPLIHKSVNKLIKKCGLFDDEPRIKAGVNRFKNVFLLSPSPLWKKLSILFNLEVIYSIVWVLTAKIRKIFIKEA